VEVCRSKLKGELTSLLRCCLPTERSEINNKLSHVNLTSGNLNIALVSFQVCKIMRTSGAPQIGSSQLELGPIVKCEDTKVLQYTV
jgi:hypothetical protein